MLASSFQSVVATDGSAKLTDLTVGGYDPYDEDADEGGTSGEFRLQFLNGSGVTTATYAWYDDDTLAAGWYTRNGGAIDGGASSIKLAAASAVWTTGKGLSMTSAGAVANADIVVKTASSGNMGIGNTTPVDVTLADLVVSGYDPYDEDADEGGTSGEFRIQFLNGSGQTTATYAWYDDDTLPAGWYTRNGGAIDGGAESVKIKAGEGVWATGKGLTLTIPSPIAAE